MDTVNEAYWVSYEVNWVAVAVVAVAVVALARMLAWTGWRRRL